MEGVVVFEADRVMLPWRPLGKTKEEGGEGNEANTCFMAQDVSEGY
jgi:hypothetical protein